MQRLLFLIDLLGVAFFLWLFSQLVLWLKRNYFKNEKGDQGAK